MSYIFKKGATSQAIELYIVDSTDGTPETGVVFDTAGIDLKYRRKDGPVVSITEADLTTPELEDTWESGGFLEIGNGVYRLDLPDAALASASGIDRVVVFGTVTGMVVLPVTIHLYAVWDELLTGSSHNIATSAGKRLRQIEEAFVHASGVIATVTNGHTFTLDAGAVATADYYVGDRLQLVEGTGAGQSRVIVAYSAGKVVTLDSDFITNPDTSTLYEVNAADVHVSISDADQAQGFVATYTNTTTITLDAAAVATTDYYTGSLIVFTHGTGAGQVREITGYTNGRVVTMSPALATALDTTTVWHIQAAVSAAVIVDEWELQSQADPTGFHVNVKEVNGTGQAANDNSTDINTLITQVGTAGDGLTNINLPNQTMNITGDITGNLSGSVGSLTGHTNQTGDSFAIVNGAAGLVAIDTVVDAIKAVTDDMKVLDTTVASVTTPDTVFVLTAGLTGNDDPNNAVVSIRDTTGGIWSGPRRVSDYVHASKTLTIDANTAFPLAAGDRVVIWNVSYATTAAAGSVTPGDIADIVDGVWDEAEDDHVTPNTTGAKQKRSDLTGR